jgi:Ca2+-binding EF-hand superfamily protein
MAAQDGISKEQVRKMFDMFDADQSGTIDRSELRVLCFALVSSVCANFQVSSQIPTRQIIVCRGGH